MKMIGLLGGMSWESSLEYYRIINQLVKARLGGLHSARCLLYSVDFDEIESYQSQGSWDRAGEVLGSAAHSLEIAGADCIVICTNTMHKVADVVQSGLEIPLIHIADATAQEIQGAGMHKIGLLGTRFTMQESFYTQRLVESFGLQVIIPEDQEMREVDRIIYGELVLGEIKEPSRDIYRNVIEKLAGKGAEGIILGCTEIGLLVRPEDSDLPLFDTTQIHARAAVDFALAA